jgi:hypothetical protein
VIQKLSSKLEKPLRGRVHVRFNAARQTSRYRFNGVHPDQSEVIQLALERARIEGNTEFDTAALEYICLQYLGRVY